jgi:hypothetical protein
MIPEELYENEPYKVEQVDENGKTVTVLTGPNGWRIIHRDVRDGGLNPRQGPREKAERGISGRVVRGNGLQEKSSDDL